MACHQSYYYEDSEFELELNLQSIRRELIDVLDEFEETVCPDCCNLKGCTCPQPSVNSLERAGNIPEASAKVLQERSRESSFNYRETLVRRLLCDQEAYPEVAEQIKVNTAQRIYHSARLKDFKMMRLESSAGGNPILCWPQPRMVYSLAPPAGALPHPVWVGLTWPQTYPFMMPRIPGVPVSPVIPTQGWPMNLHRMANASSGIPYPPPPLVQPTPNSPVDAFFGRFQTPRTSGTKTSKVSKRISDQVVPGASQGSERLSR